jgi:hypothetical protein
LGAGKLSPRDYWWPDGFANYISEKAQEVTDAYNKIPEQHKERFEEYMRNNPEKVAKSKQIDAMKHDHEMFGDKIFR